jgi:hypothetical protein
MLPISLKGMPKCYDCKKLYSKNKFHGFLSQSVFDSSEDKTAESLIVCWNLGNFACVALFSLYRYRYRNYSQQMANGYRYRYLPEFTAALVNSDMLHY